MKLHEFLKQFEGLDPELEIVQEHYCNKKIVIPYCSKIKISYIHSEYIDAGYQHNKKTKFYDKKVIVLY